MRFGPNYKHSYEMMATHELTEIATKYSAYEFFMDRQNITAAMQKALNDHFVKDCLSTIDFFQLRAVDLPKRFEEAIQMSEVKKQEIQRAYAEKNKTVVELETAKQVAELRKQITVNLAEGDAEALLTQNKADVDSFLIVQDSNSKSYGKLKKDLTMTTNDLLTFMKSKLLKDYKGDDLVVSLDSYEKEKPKQGKRFGVGQRDKSN
eukprot:TRINITY_DN2267_c0_g1_i13.p2 TRINITY_DN2267_c0_g1~~TRINITY_DN2267_c0_g1_i13.p2  ORF type:complete len:206 (+),score=43.23 TRINITY_DN2267_c0_g1_i13:548-1165(+)